MRFQERYLRPSEVDALIGDAPKGPGIFAGTPPTLTLTITPRFVATMVDAAIEHVEDGLSGDHERQPREATL